MQKYGKPRYKIKEYSLVGFHILDDNNCKICSIKRILRNREMLSKIKFQNWKKKERRLNKIIDLHC